MLQAPKPSPGPHKQRECLPLTLMLRNRLKSVPTLSHLQHSWHLQRNDASKTNILMCHPLVQLMV